MARCVLVPPWVPDRHVRFPNLGADDVRAPCQETRRFLARRSAGLVWIARGFVGGNSFDARAGHRDASGRRATQRGGVATPHPPKRSARAAAHRRRGFRCPGEGEGAQRKASLLMQFFVIQQLLLCFNSDLLTRQTNKRLARHLGVLREGRFTVRCGTPEGNGGGVDDCLVGKIHGCRCVQCVVSPQLCISTFFLTPDFVG